MVFASVAAQLRPMSKPSPLSPIALGRQISGPFWQGIVGLWGGHVAAYVWASESSSGGMVCLGPANPAKHSKRSFLRGSKRGVWLGLSGTMRPTC